MPNVKSKKLPKKPFFKHKLFLPAVVLVLIAGVGAYYVNKSSASNYYVSFLGQGCTTTPTLKQGSTGNCVKSVQVAMNNYSAARARKEGGAYKYVALSVDGIFGTKTTERVKEYQRYKTANGKKLAVDGIVGSATWSVILDDCMCFNACPNPTPSPTGGK